MGNRTARARLWVGAVVALGAGVLGWSLGEGFGGPLGWHALDAAAPWLLLALAALTHAFPVVAPRHQAYHTSQTFLLAAVLLLPWPLVPPLVALAHAAEWLRRRRPLHIQLYNLATYVLSAGAARLTFDWLGGARPFQLADPAQVAAAVGAGFAFLLANHLLTALALALARRIPLRASGLLGLESLAIDGVLLALGIAVAGAWSQHPLVAALAAAPLWLVYRALRTPGLEETAHHDRITGLHNRRHLLEALELELQRASQLGGTTGLVVLAVERADEHARRLGPASVDFLVAAVAERVATVLRPYDVVARIDPTRIGVLVPQCHAAEIGELARRAAQAVAATPLGVAVAREPVAATVATAWQAIEPGEPRDGRQLLESLLRRPLDGSADEAAGTGRASEPPLDEHIAAPAALPSAVLPRLPGETGAPPWAHPPGQAAPDARHAIARGQSAFPRRASPRVRLAALQVAAAAPALLLTVLALRQAWPLDAAGLGPLVALAVLSELLALQLYDRSSFSINFTPILASVVLFGPAGGAASAWAAALARGILRRSRWDKVLFNGSAFVLGAMLASAVYALHPQALQAEGLGTLAGLTLVASAAYYLHTFLVAGALSLDMGTRLGEVWTRNYRWLFPHYAILGLMGLGLALASRAMGPLGTVLFFAPALMMRFVLKQYVDRTSVAVQKLQSANAGLARSAQQLREQGAELSLLSDIGRSLAREPQPDRVAMQVAERCVPLVGEVVAVVWHEPEPGGRSVASTDTAARARDWLEAASAGAVRSLAECAAGCGAPPDYAQLPGGGEGRWLCVPLAGRTRALGWLLAWSRSTNDRSTQRRLALAQEVAQAVALSLENGVLLQEATTVEALHSLDRAKADFIATAAHELRTPLTSLQGFAELLRTRDVDPALQQRWLAILEQEAAQLGQLVDQLLDVSRLETGGFRVERRSCALGPLIARVVEAFAAQARQSGHSLEVDVPTALPRAYADPQHLERVLRNLLSNALKYSPGGGTIRVTARAAARELEVSVADQGIGIPPEWLDQLFRRFQRVEAPPHGSIRGTGLGLYISRHLVELSGGQISVRSEGSGKGATFTFTLPLAPAAVSPRHRSSRGASPRPSRHRTSAGTVP